MFLHVFFKDSVIQLIPYKVSLIPGPVEWTGTVEWTISCLCTFKVHVQDYFCAITPCKFTLFQFQTLKGGRH